MSANDPAPYVPPPVKHMSARPLGNLPKHAQNWLIGGIAAVMVLAIAFSGRNGSDDRTGPPKPASASVADPNAARIQEYRARIEEQARKLATEQARLTQAQQNLTAAPAPLATAAGAPYLAAPRSGGHPSGRSDGVSSALQRQREEIAAVKARREYESLFASNLALDHRAPARASDTQKAPGPRAKSEDTTYPVMEGTVIETVLTNRLDGSFSGPVNCLVTTAVYSRDRQRVLIPQGSRVLGEVQQVDSFGQQRLAVTFHRLLLPNGQSVGLEAVPGLNQIGETGLVDRVNRHYLQVFGVSMAIGAIAGLSQANTSYGPDRSAVDNYRQGVAASVSQTSLNILDRYLNVLPTFTIVEGHRVKVYLTRDLALPAYDERHATSDL